MIKSRKILSFLLALLLMGSMLLPAQAATAKVPTRAIAIVFDNSGSMYVGENAKAWCRATYAIEVFASMMNDGDTLNVYPMYEVNVDGKTYSDTHAVELTNQNSSLIRTMFTPKAEDTPIEAIDHAFTGLSAMSADEKWLIVLTDGAEFFKDGQGLGEGEPTKIALTECLTKYNNKVNVMYLGIGAVAVEPEINGTQKHYVAAAKDTANVLGELTSMCNMIFGRDMLQTDGSTISFDIPMSKIIVFVQGDNITNVQATDASGKIMGEIVSTVNPRYGEKGSGNYSVQVDTSLQGSIITYANCEKGNYSLNYDGTMSSISVYYEPDVDLFVTLKNPEGNVITPDAAYEGTYTVEYHMVDKYGEMTESALLGNMNYTFTYNISGTDYTYESASAGEFTLEKDLAAGDTLQLEADVEYLSGYKIHKGHDDLLPGFSNPITVVADNSRFKLKLEATQDYFQISRMASGAPVLANATIEDQPLSAADMERAEFSVVLKDSDGNVMDPSNYEVTKVSGESLWQISLKNGKGMKSGKYTLEATAKTINHSNQEMIATDSEKLTISAYPQWLIPLLVALGIVLVLVLLWLYFNAKVLPRGVTCTGTKFMVDGELISGEAVAKLIGGKKKHGTVTITSPRVVGNMAAKCSLKMNVEAVSPRRTLNTSKRAMRVTGISTTPGNGNIQTVMVNGNQFKWSAADKKYVKLGGKADSPISAVTRNMSDFAVSGQMANGTSISMRGKLKHL